MAGCLFLLRGHASGGYPAAYKTGYPIFGLDTLPTDCPAFHAGTRMEGDQFVTGGRIAWRGLAG